MRWYRPARIAVCDGALHHTDTLRHRADIGHPCPSGAISGMADLHLHLDGTAPDHAEWAADERDDLFDAGALEQAMLESRAHAYAELRELAPA